MNKPLLYLAAQQGTFGQRTEFSQSSITDALFVYLDGEPEDESVARVDDHFRNRPLVCLTKAWEEQIRAQYPDAAIYPRTVMKPVCRFILPENIEIPEGYRLAGMDEAAFEQHPFSHGENYSSFTAFQAEGSGAVVYDGNEIVGTFYYTQGQNIEPTYLEITDGRWLDDSPYGVVHRVASDGSEKGIGAFCINWAFEQCGHLRMDTHTNNVIMQHVLDKLGFTKCGIIYVVEDHYPRYAYEKIK